MTKLLVFSDSHGNTVNMVAATLLEKPDRILFLGDGLQDAEALREHFPDIPLDAVAGNCDLGAFQTPRELLLFVEDASLLLCHGHTLGVKYDLYRAVCSARERGADALLFGHTHRPLIDHDGSILLVNPGSIHDFFAPSYAVIAVNGRELSAASHVLRR